MTSAKVWTYAAGTSTDGLHGVGLEELDGVRSSPDEGLIVVTIHHDGYLGSCRYFSLGFGFEAMVSIIYKDRATL